MYSAKSFSSNNSQEMVKIFREKQKTPFHYKESHKMKRFKNGQEF